ncbi:FecR domain-containing protein [Candidatus Peregrinibacteria bacterium]|nr:FecR domain-containing protein [Candidatus Peregrinibacteria bacterium]
MTLHRLPRKRPIDYILPFLIIICTGVIVVLGYQLWTSLNTDNNEKDIYMYVAQGSSKILPWGAGEWERGYNGTRLLQGDSLKTQSGGRIVMEFFNDHYIRLDESTELSLNEIKKNGEAYEITVILSEGKIWINNNENSQTPVKFTVQTNHTVVKTVGTIYEIEQTAASEVLRVIKGAIMADIFIDDNGKKSKVETLQIGVGQEAILTDQVIQQYVQRLSPSVVNALSDIFKDSGFYKWNMAEDQNPTDFTSSSYVATLSDEFATPEISTEETSEAELASPVITVPSSLNFSTPESSLTIRGTTVSATKKMMVEIKAGSATNTYELNLYMPGNTDWSFIVSQDAGTMKTGLNEYYFYALGDEDAKSAKTKLIVAYNSETSEEEDDEPAAQDLGPLTAPVVVSYNGSPSNTVEQEPIRVSGTVSGAEKVIVNGYQLSAFKSGDTTWIYNVKESYGNLKPGENTYTVEAVGKDGSKKSTEFVIIYNKPAAEETTPEETITEETATPEAET